MCRKRGLFLDHDGGLFIYEIEQLDDIGVAHPDAPVAVGPANLVFVFGAVNVDETPARVHVVIVQAIEPENARSNQVLGRWKRVFGFQRHPALKNCPDRHAVTDLCRHAKIPGGRFVAAFFHAQAEARTRDRKFFHRFIATLQSEHLIANGDVDPGAGTLHIM